MLFGVRCLCIGVQPPLPLRRCRARTALHQRSASVGKRRKGEMRGRGTWETRAVVVVRVGVAGCVGVGAINSVGSVGVGVCGVGDVERERLWLVLSGEAGCVGADVGVL